jgi:hypothetical protein
MSELGFGGQWVAILRRLALVFLCLTILLNIGYLVLGRAPSPDQLSLPGKFYSEKGNRLLNRHRELLQFLHDHGTQAEEALYLDFTSSSIAAAAMASDQKNSNKQTELNEKELGISYVVSMDTDFFVSIYYQLLFFQIQLLFIVAASWRFWLLGTLGGAVWGTFQLQEHRGRDILGVLSNGRLFFSGIIVGLKKVTKKGEPDVHVPGLACLPKASPQEIAKSPFILLLNQFKALNKTNRSLVSFVISVPDLPSFLSSIGTEPIVERTYSHIPLYRHAYYMLERALSLHAMYKQRATQGGAMDGELGISSGSIPGREGRIEVEDYADFLVNCFHRVLTPKLRTAFSEWSPHEVAAFVLAMYAGRHLTYDKEVGDRWSVVSTFPELNARAAIQSVTEYGDEFPYDRRSMIRRALIYSTRSATFEINRFPAEMNDETLAGRQIGELLLTPPHRLAVVADEVELFGLAREAYQSWKKQIIAAFAGSEAMKLKEGAFLSPSGDVIFLSVHKILALSREVLPKHVFDRSMELVDKIGEERLRCIKSKEDVAPHLSLIPELLTRAEFNELIRGHEISEEDLKDWLSLRYMLRNFSALAQRVGDKANGPSQIIYLVRERVKVFRTNDEEQPLKKVSEYNGGCGVVPLRVSMLNEELGEAWKHGLVQPKRIHVPGNRREFDALLQSTNNSNEKKSNSFEDGKNKEKLNGNVQRVVFTPR